MRDGRSHNVCLIADDDLFIRQIVSKILFGMAEIITATDGAECLKLYQEHKPDIAFIDIHLPIQTGFELTERLLRHDPDAYLVIMSSDSTAENVQDALQRGARGFLAKPIQRVKLLQYFNQCPTIGDNVGESAAG